MTSLSSYASALNSVIEALPFCALAIDVAGNVTSANDCAASLFGYDQGELLRKNLNELISVSDISINRVDEHLCIINALRKYAKPTTTRAAWIARKGSKAIPIQVSTSELRTTPPDPRGMIVICYDLTERKHAEFYIRHMATHDPLTGLPNRLLLQDRLQVSIERAKRDSTGLSLMVVNLDNFRRINDSLGGHAGDSVLREMALRIRTAVRKSDTVARIGGDEFAVVTSDFQDVKLVPEVAAKLLKALQAPFQIDDKTLSVTASIGVSVFPGNSTAEALLRNADYAMHSRKAHGRNGLEVFKQTSAIESSRVLELESELRNAIQAQELEIVYQPQISFSDHSLIGVEALLRWNSARFGRVMPNDFIPIAEDTGLIVPISEWVLRTACSEIAQLQLEIGKDIGLAVNVSPRQFQQTDFPQTIKKALRESGLRPDQLELEITESLLMVDSAESLEIMSRVRKLGVHFAIDDFGTGFSNMAYITRFAVDRIKIDRSFVKRCHIDKTSQAVTTTIIALAHSLGIEVIAEGVETTEQVEELVRMNCDQAQGYLYARPLSLAATKRFAAAAKSPDIPDGQSGIRRAYCEIQDEASLARS